MLDRPRHLKGFLLTASADAIQQCRRRMAEDSRFRDFEALEGTRWESFKYVSATPLLDEDPAAGPFQYPMTLRLSRERALLFGRAKPVARAALDDAISRITRPPLRILGIRVDRLVRRVTADAGTGYALTFAHARFPAGGGLDSMSYYGEDIADSRYFRDGIDLVTFHSCGLRVLPTQRELVRFSSDGSVAIRYWSASQVTAVERMLRFISTNGFLDRGADDFEL